MPAGIAAADDDGGELGGYRRLPEFLRAVSDPRRKRGIRHRAAVVLVFAVAAVLAGADSVTAIIEWAADAPPEILRRWMRRTGRAGRRAPPSASTFRWMLRLLDAQAAAAAFGSWLRGQAGLADTAGLVIALDGKTVRGARSGNGQLRLAVAALALPARPPGAAARPGIGRPRPLGHRGRASCRDTTMNEDAQRLRTGASAQVIAAVRSAAVAALRLAGFTSTASGRR